MQVSAGCQAARIMPGMVVILALWLVLGLTGCVLPIPHMRVHAYGAQGLVLDAQTRSPILAAKVSTLEGELRTTQTDAKGHFVLPAIYGWHGAYLISPISQSLAPGFDVAVRQCRISITAPGYEDREFEISGNFPNQPGQTKPKHGQLPAGEILIQPLPPP
jgi:hypothetical protein